MKYVIGMIAILAVILASIFVYAAGSSTIPSQPTPTPTISDKAMEKKDCETIAMRIERIKCRLQNKTEEGENIDYEARIPEACKTLRNPTACIALYKNVQARRCYDMEGRDKDKCFKETAGIRSNFSGLIPEERAQKAREYLVFLLYEFEERIEDDNKKGLISDDSAAEIIELITQIKEDILSGKNRVEIMPKFNELKQKIRAVRS